MAKSKNQNTKRKTSVVVETHVGKDMIMKVRELPILNPDGKRWKKFEFSKSNETTMTSKTVKSRLKKALENIKEKKPDDAEGLFTVLYKFGDGSYRQVQGYHDLDWLIDNLPTYWEAEHLNYENLKEYYATASIDNFAVIYDPSNKQYSGRGTITSSCLWDALTELGFKSSMKSITNDAQLKRHLKLNQEDGISIDLIPQVEHVFKVNISIYGDYRQPSTGTHTDRINLKLENGHYSFEDVQLKAKTVAIYEQTMILYSPYYENETKVYLCIYLRHKHNTQEVVEFELTHEQFIPLLNRKRDAPECEYIKNINEYRFCESSYNKQMNLTKKQLRKRLRMDYNELITNCKILHDEFKIETGRYGYSKQVNLRRDGTEGTKYNTKAIALEIFNQLRTKQIIPEPISQIEFEYLEDATGSSMFYCKEKELKVEHGYNYDFNSFYMELLTRQNFLIPAQNPQFMNIKSIDEIKEKVYIVDCIIEGDSPYFIKKRKYTSYDIYLAKLLNLTIKIKPTDKANVMYYSKNDCIQSRNLLTPYVEKLYKLKTEHKGIFKQLLMLWGYLCEKNTQIKTFTDDSPLNMNSNISIEYIKETNVGHRISYTDRQENYYTTNYARLKPFLLSYSRSDLFRQIQPHLDSIVHINVDGFLSTKKLDIKLGTEIGDLKLDKEGACIVHCINNVEWL